MDVSTRSSLTKGFVVRAFNAVRQEVALPTTQRAASFKTATRTAPIVAPSVPQQQLRPSPPGTKQQPLSRRLSCSALRCPAIDSGGALASGSLRKRRVPTWRSLSTRASDGDNSGGRLNLQGITGSCRVEGPEDEDNSCWKCKSSVSLREFFCLCGAAQLLDGRLDYFEMFGCPPSVFLDLKGLEAKFKDMQRAFHPVSTERQTAHNVSTAAQQ